MYVSVNDEDEATDHTCTSCIILGTWHPVLYGKGRTLQSGRAVSRHVTTTVCVYNLWRSELHFPFPLHPFLVSSSAGLGVWDRENRVCTLLRLLVRIPGNARGTGNRRIALRAIGRNPHARQKCQPRGTRRRRPARRQTRRRLSARKASAARARSSRHPHRSSAPPRCRTCGGRSRYARLQERARTGEYYFSKNNITVQNNVL